MRLSCWLHQSIASCWRGSLLAGAAKRLSLEAGGERLMSVCIVGRPNVGKSTLFNALRETRRGRRLGSRIVPPQLTGQVARTTRDVRKALGRLADLNFWIVDTAGYEERDELGLHHYGSNWCGMSAAMIQRAELAVLSCDAVLFLLDGVDGVTGADVEVSDWLRKIDAPRRILVFNKCENGREPMDQEYALRRFASGKRDHTDIVKISATHGDGMPDLLLALSAVVPKAGISRETPDFERAIRIAFVGRPNAGKSSLLNALVGEEAALTASTPGVTRDPVEALVWHEGRAVMLVDTAGVRGGSAASFGKSRAPSTLRPYELGSLRLTQREIRANADVVVMLVDTTERMRTDDWRLVRACLDDAAGAFLIAGTKADACHSSPEEIRIGIADTLRNVSKQLSVVPCSAIRPTSSTHPSRLLDAALAAHDRHSTKRVRSSIANSWLRDWLATPFGKPHRKLRKIRFIAQVQRDPPTFAIFGRNLSASLDRTCFDALTHAIASDLGFEGARIKLICRNTATPYLKAQRTRVFSQPFNRAETSKSALRRYRKIRRSRADQAKQHQHVLHANIRRKVAVQRGKHEALMSASK